MIRQVVAEAAAHVGQRAAEGDGAGDGESWINLSGLQKLALGIIAVLLLWAALKNQKRADKGDIQQSLSVLGVSGITVVLVAMAGIVGFLALFLQDFAKWILPGTAN